MLVFIGTFSSLSAFLFGYDLGLMGGALLHIQRSMSIGDGISQVIVGSAKLGAVFGTFIGGACMLYYGRRKSIAIDSMFFLIGPLLMAGAWNVIILIIGRVLIGLGIGFSAVVIPTYLGEMAPAESRGRVVELYEVMLCIGMLSASLVNAALENLPGNWRFMVGAPIIPAAMMSVTSLFLPESPRWLVTMGRLEEALGVIHKVHTRTTLPLGENSSTEEVESELLELWSSVEKDKAAVASRHQEFAWRRSSKKFQKCELREISRADSERKPHEGTPTPPSSPRALKGLGIDGPQQDPIPLGISDEPSSSNLPSHEHTNLLGSSHTAAIDFSNKRIEEGTNVESQSIEPLLQHSNQTENATIPKEMINLPTGENCNLLCKGDPRSDYFNKSSQNHVNMENIPHHQGERGLVIGEERHMYRSIWSTLYGVLIDVFSVALGPERAAFWMIVILAFFNQAFASTAIINYAPALFEYAGLKSGRIANLLTSLIGGAKLFGIIAGFLMVDSVGRRPLLISGSLGCTISLCVITVGGAVSLLWLLLGSMCTFIFSFSVSWAGVFWVLLSEVFSMSVKSPAVAAATAVLFLTGGIADSIFLSLNSALGPFSFLIYSSIACISGMYVFFYVPETKGRTLQDIQHSLCRKGN